MNVFEMKCLRTMQGVTRMDIVMCKEVCGRAEMERELAGRVDQKLQRWFGLVERMDEYRWAEECRWRE